LDCSTVNTAMGIFLFTNKGPLLENVLIEDLYIRSSSRNLIITSQKRHETETMNTYNLNKAKCATAINNTKKAVSKFGLLKKRRSVKEMCNRQASVVIKRRNAIESAHAQSLCKTTSSSTFKLGHTLHVNSLGQLRISFKHNGQLNEALKNDIKTNVHLSVKLSTEKHEHEQSVCLVREGQQLTQSTITFESSSSVYLKNATLRFRLCFVTGRFFKRKDIITKWSVPVNAENYKNVSYVWRPVKHLS